MRRVLPLSVLLFALCAFPASGILDTNSNGLSDLWETMYNDGDLFPSTDFPYGLQDDTDGDGWTNAQEAAAGTNPFDANPPDGLIRPDSEYIPGFWADVNNDNELELVPASIRITWPTIQGKQYTLLYSPDLTEWLSVADWTFIGDGSPAEYIITLAQDDKLFWSVKIEDVDSDGDGLTDAEEEELGTDAESSETLAGIPDSWLALHYPNVNGFEPNGDDDNDGLSNFEEYLHGTNPKLADTDGDGTTDIAEVNHGGNPNDASDGGTAPADLLEEVAFTVGGDYASWRMEIHGKGPRDQRILRLASQNPGDTETRTFKLHRNNRYEITLHRTGGVEDWYCWDARLNNLPDAATFDDTESYYELGERNDQSHFLTVAGHWLVDNRQGLLTSHLHSYQNDVASPLKAELIPVAIEDNIDATGVDIVSNSVASDVPGYQDKLWLMAPIAGPPPPADYSNAMKFNIPLNPAADLEMECDHATPDPSTITLNNGKPSVLWRGSGDNQTNENTTAFKIGAHEGEVDLPIGVMTMKHRTVKVAVYPVRCKAGNRPVPMPDRAVLEDWLNQVFAYQLNAWIEVEYKPQTDYDYDPDNDGIAPFWTKMIPMIQEEAYQDASNDIRLFVIDWISLRELGPNDPDLNGIAQQIPPFAVVNAGFPGMSARPTQQVTETIAHELGHVVVGSGHPDEGDGRAPLPGTDHSKRLMSTFSTRAAGAKLLMKDEWEAADIRLEIIENLMNQQ